MSKYIFDIMKKEQMKSCIILIDESYSKNIGKSDYEYESKQIFDPPWQWFNQDNLYSIH